MAFSKRDSASGLVSKVPEMLYHFSITPDAFESAAINEMTPPGVVLLELLKGMCDNGLLANLHAGRWMTEIRRHQSNADIPPSVRDRIEACLSVLHDRNRLIRHPAGIADHEKDDFRWLKWSLERHRADSCNPLAGVFSTDDFIELSELTDSVLIGLSTALDADCWVNRERSIRFTKITANLRLYLTPIVRYAQKVTLIDPYMTCREPRFLDTVQHCADLLGKHDDQQSSGMIHIHAGDPTAVGNEDLRESVDDRLERWETELKPIAGHWGHTFRVFLWGRKPGGKLFHDRYIITDQCGLDAPGGLDFLPDGEAERANQTTWSILNPKDIRQILLEEFHHAKSPYRHLGSRLIEA